jgi:hypothetical protein
MFMTDYDKELDEIINAIINACEASSIGEITPALFEEMMDRAKELHNELLYQAKLDGAIEELEECWNQGVKNNSLELEDAYLSERIDMLKSMRENPHTHVIRGHADGSGRRSCAVCRFPEDRLATLKGQKEKL